VSATYDYVCDVRWSPTNPAVFCTITSGGMLTLWDLSRSTLEPQDYFNVLKDSSSATTGGASNLALNKVTWSLDGGSLYVGDTRGSVKLISVRETSARARAGDDARYKRNKAFNTIERFGLHSHLHLFLYFFFFCYFRRVEMALISSNTRAADTESSKVVGGLGISPISSFDASSTAVDLEGDE